MGKQCLKYIFCLIRSIYQHVNYTKKYNSSSFYHLSVNLEPLKNIIYYKIIR